MTSRNNYRTSIEEWARLGKVIRNGGAVGGEVFHKSTRFDMLRYVARVLAALDDQNLEGRFGRDQSPYDNARSRSAWHRMNKVGTSDKVGTDMPPAKIISYSEVIIYVEVEGESE